jgi:DNA-binding transcriptional ArsR family regulator
MSSDRARLILHPVRYQIIQAMLGGRRLTPQQLAAELPDVPQATLYRHIRRLNEGGVLVVAEEYAVRGATERVYALSDNTVLSGADMAGVDRDAHLQAFQAFTGALLAEFERYLQREPIDLEADGAGYRQAALYLSDAELLEMAQALNAAMRPFLENEPGPERRRRLFATVLMPME